MTMQPGERDPREGEERVGRQRAVKAMRDARATIRDQFGPDLPSQVEEALDKAERELYSASECRQAKPFAPIIQIGDKSGLYYACTHNPVHRY